MSALTVNFDYGDWKVTMETGRIARQASGSVLISMGDTMVLTTVVGQAGDATGRDFFPLTVDYQEKTYAAGKIPGGFFKREGRPSEKETLVSRLIDRPIRPLFPKGFMNEVQVICTVISLDPNVDPDIPALLGASAALSISGLPFEGPIGAARVGYKNGEYILNPSFTDLDESKLDLVVAGTKSSVLMVESEADCLTEEVMLGAVNFGHEHSKDAIAAIEELKSLAPSKSFLWTRGETNTELETFITQNYASSVKDAYRLKEKSERKEKIGSIKNDILEGVQDKYQGLEASEVVSVVHSLERQLVREMTLTTKERIDGRGSADVRPIHSEIGLLPRTHGSALFTRGETQALVVTSLGAERDSQIIDALEGEYREPFMLHYNFPPFCVGETGRVGSPKRREIGHGKLAKRGIAAVMPSLSEFPYVIRVVSEITESNGSSSMASVCGTSLSLMDAGVPIKNPVAGIAMGLIKEEDQFIILSDIMGDEDHLGDMDFKVAGTSDGITALQMDIKINGITTEIMSQALAQAKDGRMHILNEMAKSITTPRTEMSKHAPRIISFRVPTDKIRDVIGKGGATIRQLTEETGATIDIDDDGTVKIASVDFSAGELARSRIELITADVEVGAVYEGKVQKLMDFGAFVNILPGKDGLVHISQISEERVENVSDKLSEGELVKVKVLEVDKQGRIRLSMKAVQE